MTSRNTSIGLSRTRRPGDGLAGQRTRSATRPIPVSSEDHRHLSLQQLRCYREALQAEEDRVAYWRRIVRARLDVIAKGRAAGHGSSFDFAHVSPMLTDARLNVGRPALIRALPADDLPPLPNLRKLWETPVDPQDHEALQELQRDLAEAERQLSAYRATLHRRLQRATAELVARYRLQPVLSLSVLPLPQPAGKGA